MNFKTKKAIFNMTTLYLFIVFTAIKGTNFYMYPFENKNDILCYLSEIVSQSGIKHKNIKEKHYG